MNKEPFGPEQKPLDFLSPALTNNTLSEVVLQGCSCVCRRVISRQRGKRINTGGNRGQLHPCTEWHPPATFFQRDPGLAAWLLLSACLPVISPRAERNNSGNRENRRVLKPLNPWDIFSPIWKLTGIQIISLWLKLGLTCLTTTLFKCFTDKFKLLMRHPANNLWERTAAFRHQELPNTKKVWKITLDKEWLSGVHRPTASTTTETYPSTFKIFFDVFNTPWEAEEGSIEVL